MRLTKEQLELEKALNNYLQKTLATYSSLLEKKRPELAEKILAYGSANADLILEASGIRDRYTRRVCPICRKPLSNALDIIAVNGNNRCLSCDHIEGDYE